MIIITPRSRFVSRFSRRGVTPYPYSASSAGEHASLELMLSTSFSFIPLSKIPFHCVTTLMRCDITCSIHHCYSFSLLSIPRSFHHQARARLGINTHTPYQFNPPAKPLSRKPARCVSEPRDNLVTFKSTHAVILNSNFRCSNPPHHNFHSMATPIVSAPPGGAPPTPVSLLSTVEASKRAAAYKAVEDHFDPSYRYVGIGSGSTVVYVVEAIVAQGTEITSKMRFIPTGE